MKKQNQVVSYLRVSTRKQGINGLIGDTRVGRAEFPGDQTRGPSGVPRGGTRTWAVLERCSRGYQGVPGARSSVAPGMRLDK